MSGNDKTTPTTTTTSTLSCPLVDELSTTPRLKRQSTPLMSTPSAVMVGRPELPRPNESLASIGLPEEILNLEQIHTAPLETPQPKKRSLGRSNTMGPSAMRSLDTDSEEEIQNETAPPAVQNDADMSIASTQDINELLKSINEMTSRFDKLEKSLKK